MTPPDQKGTPPSGDGASPQQLLEAREESVAQAWVDIEAVMADLREANAHLVLANIQSQVLAVEMSRLHEEANEAARAKDEFFAHVSHELRSPLTSIAGWAALLGVDPDPATITAAARSIASSAALQAKLINDLLDVSRIITQKFSITTSEIDFRPAVEEAIMASRPIVETKGLSLVLDLGDSLMVNGDVMRLRQVVDNLLSNAVKFTPAGGTIEVRLAGEGSHAVLCVRDSGEGILLDFLPHVFDRHAQADAARLGGLGLGLAIVKHIVEMHGGLVEAESQGLGTGAAFTVRIPALAR